MTTLTEGPIQSDQALLAHLGLTTEQAAAYVGVSRTSLTKGLSHGTQFLRPQDILQLRFITHAHEKFKDLACNDDAITEYVRQHRGDGAANEVETGFSLMSAAPNLESCEELWIVIAHVQGLLDTGRIEDVRSLFALPAKLTVYLTHNLEDERFRAAVGEQVINDRVPPVEFRHGSCVGSQYTLLISSPHRSDAQVFLHSKRGFICAPFLAATVKNILFLFERKTHPA